MPFPTNPYNLPTVGKLIHWLWLWGAYPVIVAVGIGSTIVLSKIIERYYLTRHKTVLLRLTPYASADKLPFATEQLFAVIHGLAARRPWYERIVRYRMRISFEIVASRSQGIGYMIYLDGRDVLLFKHALHAYAPDVNISAVADTTVSQAFVHPGCIRLLSFKQTAHYAYPLRIQSTFADSDPGAYLTEAMTKLGSGEVVTLQLVAVPAQVRAAHLLANRIARNETILRQLDQSPLKRALLNGMHAFLFGIVSIVGEVTHSLSYTQITEHAQLKSPAAIDSPKSGSVRPLSLLERQLAETVHGKLTQPLFRVNVRAIIVSKSPAKCSERAALLVNSLRASEMAYYQSFKSRSVASKRYSRQVFSGRYPSLFAHNSSLLSTAEMAQLFHFPHSQTNRTENLGHSLARTLPAPITLKTEQKPDIVLGRNYYQGVYTDIGLSSEERQRHMYVIGGTGNGKSTLLKSMIIQDIAHGKGVAVVDPHGDLAQEILNYIPRERLADVIYFNPDDLDYPIGLNLLEVPIGLSGKTVLREQAFVEDAIVSIFRKLFSEGDSTGHRIEYVLRNCIQTAFTIQDATIFTIHKLLTNRTYRNQVVALLDDEFLKNFWQGEFSRAGSFQQVRMMAGVTAKIGQFYAAIQTRQILEQPRSTIDFDDILDGKILICNLAKGRIGEATSELFGTAILAKLQLAAYRRIRKTQSARRPFYLYVDEFQNFATPLFVQILSEARKYKLFVAMAEQSTSQQDRLIVENILGNVGTTICFRTANPADEDLMLRVFSDHVRRGEIAHLPAYNFYIKLNSLQAQETYSGETILPLAPLYTVTSTEIIGWSRKQYATVLCKKSVAIKKAPKKRKADAVSHRLIPL